MPDSSATRSVGRAKKSRSLCVSIRMYWAFFAVREGDIKRLSTLCYGTTCSLRNTAALGDPANRRDSEDCRRDAGATVLSYTRAARAAKRSEEHTSELQSLRH